MTTHCTEDELILHYYGEGSPEVERHLGKCAECTAAHQSLAATLQLVPVSDVPARDDSYPMEVWQRLRGHLPERNPPWWQAWFAWTPATALAGVAVLVLTAFVAGRMWPGPAPVVVTALPSIDAAASDRVRLAATGDHLEQSERVLLDLVNAQGDRVDLSDQQVWAADLIDSNRLYRDAATLAGDFFVANVLDDLERSLLDVVHGPSKVTPAQLDDVRTRVDAAALLFKVRVLADELHERESAPVPARKTL